MTTTKQIDIEEFFKNNYYSLPQTTVDLCVEVYKCCLNATYFYLDTAIDGLLVQLATKKPSFVYGIPVDGYVCFCVEYGGRITETEVRIDQQSWEGELLREILRAVSESLRIKEFK